MESETLDYERDVARGRVMVLSGRGVRQGAEPTNDEAKKLVAHGKSYYCGVCLDKNREVSVKCFVQSRFDEVKLYRKAVKQGLPAAQ